MFTGIITHTAKTLDVSHEPGGGVTLKIERVFETGEPLVTGESIAVDGCCLTVLSNTDPDADAGIRFFVSQETVDCTTIGGLRPGEQVNLERALRIGDRLGGHIVTGHVDCVGQLVSETSEAGSLRLVFSYPSAFNRLVIPKGSVTINGVSLTVNELDDTIPSLSEFSVNIIPHTAEVTNLGALEHGARVNIEFDLVGKYQQRARDLADSLQNAPA